VPIDFSDASREALRTALRLVTAPDQQLTVMHVVEPGGGRADRIFGRFLGIDSHEADNVLAKQRLEEFIHEAAPKAQNIQLLLRNGNPSHEISNTANTEAFDLMAIGTLGRSGFQEWLIGGTAERVVRLTQISILGIKPDTFAFHAGAGTRASGVSSPSGIPG
jgi:nucleotide-binding universal stress UspA family protein